LWLAVEILSELSPLGVAESCRAAARYAGQRVQVTLLLYITLLVSCTTSRYACLSVDLRIVEACVNTVDHCLEGRGRKLVATGAEHIVTTTPRIDRDS
jgi:hypothetical protein